MAQLIFVRCTFDEIVVANIEDGGMVSYRSRCRLAYLARLRIYCFLCHEARGVAPTVVSDFDVARLRPSDICRILGNSFDLEAPTAGFATFKHLTMRWSERLAALRKG